MNNKKILLILISLTFTIILIGCINRFTCSNICCQIKSGEDITFFIASDPHHLSKKTYDGGKAFQNFFTNGDGKLLNYSGEIIDAFTRDIKNKKPDILIVTGDLTGNGEKESHIEFAKKLKAIKKLGICVFVIPGNHDIENPWARNYVGDKLIKIDSISSDEFAEIYSPYGYKDAVSRDNYSLSYLATPAEDIWLLMLDSAIYNRNKVRNAPVMGGEISSKTLEWIKECTNLAKENKAKLITVMHHSLIDHSRVINEDFTIKNNKEVIKVLQESGVEIVLTGHIHLQDIKSYKEKDKIIYDIATSCLIGYPNQYGILKFKPDRGYDYRTNRIDMAGWVKENNITDENLINFKEYSRNFFKKRSYDKYYDSLLEISKYSDEEMKAISETISILNLNYFGGLRNEALHHIFHTDGFKLLQASAPNFIRDYALSMFNDEKTDNNKLFIPISLNKTKEN
jgi:3',5'-cyclic AMP phosphodiesterase CpdA